MCLYSFTSDADVERHYALIHNKVGREGNPFGFKCKFVEEGKSCGLVFPTKYFLTKHRKDSGHMIRQTS